MFKICFPIMWSHLYCTSLHFLWTKNGKLISNSLIFSEYSNCYGMWINMLNISDYRDTWHLPLLIRLEINRICVVEHTWAYAQLAHMHCLLSVCLSVTGPKFRPEDNSYLGKCSSWQPVTAVMMYCTGRMAHINVKLHFFNLGYCFEAHLLISTDKAICALQVAFIITEQGRQLNHCGGWLWAT